MTEVHLPTGATSAERLHRALEAAEVLDHDGPVRVITPPKAFLDVSALAALTSWGAWRRHHGQATDIGGDEDTRAYLARMNVLELIGAPWNTDAPRASERGRFIPVTTVGSEGAFQVTNAICDLVLHTFADGRTFLPALEWAVYEVIDNVVIHAESPLPALVCAQHYPHRKRLELSVVDVGRGIRASLGTAMALDSDADAIGKALQRGVTRDASVGQGNGLAGTREIVACNRGYLALWSGTAKYRMSGGEETGFETVPRVPGTGLMMALDTRRPVDLRDTFIQGSAWTYIDAEAERIATAGVQMISACSFFGARPPATRLRHKLLALLPDIEGPLVLDFDGVPRASSSFLDELLGRLALELGEATFRARILVRNASPAIAERANVVITQRLGRSIPDGNAE